METETTQVIEGDIIRIRPMDSRKMLGISRKHFNDEAKKLSWKSERLGTEVFYFVPVDYFQMRQKLMKLREVTTNDEVTSPHKIPQPESIVTDKELLARFEGRIQQLETQISAYSNEIEARNTALVKYKDQEKQIESLQVRINELEQRLITPWWQFWKK